MSRHSQLGVGLNEPCYMTDADEQTRKAAYHDGGHRGRMLSVRRGKGAISEEKRLSQNTYGTLRLGTPRARRSPFAPQKFLAQSIIHTYPYIRDSKLKEKTKAGWGTGMRRATDSAGTPSQTGRHAKCHGISAERIGQNSKSRPRQQNAMSPWPSGTNLLSAANVGQPSCAECSCCRRFTTAESSPKKALMSAEG
ncbi:uncharacterized protein LY79DRAFT_573770 [Colletotrichum navitas]|uniref:Uncharacterized protein n=1 Tax=Colletotrichum navitas TaxID=681940 RepID=A0AAD8UX26_9PEZI|nr:uncharacterized protein LY79DRAFT_573770 [Colletotrichum navitas]KAK1564025.1 hypothetical protein LY79DRAFT_573770 [Colletotrichum navitas]